MTDALAKPVVGDAVNIYWGYPWGGEENGKLYAIKEIAWGYEYTIKTDNCTFRTIYSLKHESKWCGKGAYYTPNSPLRNN